MSPLSFLQQCSRHQSYHLCLSPPRRRARLFTYTTAFDATMAIIATTRPRYPQPHIIFTMYFWISPSSTSGGLSYLSTLSIVVCLVSAGYIIFAYASPAYKRRQSRRNYEAIGGSANGSATPVSGAGGSATVQSRASVGGSAGAPQGGSSQNAAGGLGWRAYGSTDEAPAGAGCLPQTSSR